MPSINRSAIDTRSAIGKGFKEPDYRTAKTLPKPPFSRKQKLAEWVTAKDNPYFARAAVNRLWGQFMGRGLIHPIDDLSSKNKPSLPALLSGKLPLPPEPTTSPAPSGRGG